MSINDSVYKWNDISENNNNASQSESTKQALFIDSITTINNKPVIRFDGIDDMFNGTLIPNIGDSSLTIFIIANGNERTGTVADLFAINNYTNVFWFGQHISTSRLRIANNNGSLFENAVSMNN